jgi:type VI secretion system protein ImpF
MPHLANSVLNYGVPDLSGISVSSLNLDKLERAIRQAIWDFEPRLIRGTVTVSAMSGNVDHNKLTFEITGDLWAQPYPERLYLKTELDLERGVVMLAEVGAGSMA